MSSKIIPVGFDNITILRGSKYVGLWEWDNCDFEGRTATIKIKNIHPDFKDKKNAWEVGTARVEPLDIDGNPYKGRVEIELTKEETFLLSIPEEEEFLYDEEGGYYSVLNIILDDGTVILSANVKVINSLEVETLDYLVDEKDKAAIINEKLDNILLRNDEYISARDNLIDVVIPEALNTYNLNHTEKVQILEDIATIVGQDKNVVGQDKLDIETMKQNVQDNKDSVTSMKDAIEIMLDTFDDRFLGRKDSDPLTDNDGEPLIVAAIYYNEIDKELKFYNGASWDSPVAAAQTYAQQVTNDKQAVSLDKQTVLNAKTDIEDIRDNLQSSVDSISSKVNISDIQNTLLSIDTNKPLSAAQGKVLKDLIDYHTTLLFSDDTTLDELQEIVNYIKQNKSTLDSLGISNIAGLVDALSNKVDKVSGKGLSSNDFTTNEKNKLAGIESGAQANVTPTWNSVAEKPNFNENGFSFKKGYLTNGQIVSIDLVGITNINTINTNSIYSVHSRLTSNLPETGINGTLETLVNNQTIIITQVLINVNSKIFIRKGNKNTQVWDAWVEK